MLKDKYGKGMTVSDKTELDRVLDNAIADVGAIYGDVIDVACDEILNGDYSPALKHNAMYKTSWFRKYIQSYVEVRG